MSINAGEKHQILGIRKPASRRSKKKRRVTIADPKEESSDSSDRPSKVLKVLEKRPSILDTDILEDIRNELEDDDVEDESSLEGVEDSDENVPEKDFTLQQYFFEGMNEIPDLDDVELSEEDVPRLTIVAVESQAEAIDEGHFYDPLTGELIESSEGTPEAPEEASVEEVVEEEDEEDDILTLPEVVEDFELRRTMDEDAFGAFMELDIVKGDKRIEFDVEAMEREVAARELYDQTVEFLDELIKRIVYAREYVDTPTILRANLDKKKLMEKIVILSKEYEKEQAEHAFLNRRTIDYFRRRKFLRPIAEETVITIATDQPKYKEKLKQLNIILGAEKDAKQNGKERTEQLELELHNLEHAIASEVLEFEHRVTESLTHGKSDRIKNFIAINLRRMSRLRAEITAVRAILIQRQHTLASLTQKIEKLENLGDGLSMKNYENLQTEAQALGKKIEERNTELTKLRTRFNSDLHVKAHMTEKQQMLRSTVDIQELALEELLEEKQFCREYLYQLKLKRGEIRRDINECSFRSGILDKPALMYDYDETQEKLLIVRDRVEKTRTKFADITAKIASMEALFRRSQAGE